MKIVVLTGSPHHNGTSDTLAKEFCNGAAAAGHQVQMIRAGQLEIHPCLGCYQCGSGKCRWEDDMQQIYDAVLASDMLVLATPLYFYQMSGQLKVVLDRFLCINARVKAKRMDSALLCVGWNTDPHCMDGVKAHYEVLAKYMKWRDRGQLYAFGCTGPGDLRATDYPEQAYKIGKSL